ncbi:MAG: ABC transporter permease [Coriobacteriia bacterium]|nr:ABC transporter permease [Coriobacteriia bacterium]
MQQTVQRIVAIARKEFVHIARDWRMIVAVLIMPLLQLLLFAYAISFDVRNVPTVVFDADNTAASRDYIAAASNTGFFDVVGTVSSAAEIDQAFDRGVARVVIVVEKGFGTALAQARTANATVLVDGSEPNSAQLGRSYAIALNTVYGNQVLSRWASARGSTLSVGRAEARLRTWYNPERSSADFLIPGLMVVIIMIVTVQQTAVTLVRERDAGTLEQLVVSPLRQGELIVGKVMPWAILGFADTVMITAVSLAVFHVPLRGDVSVLVVSMFLFVLCCLAIGLVISAVAPSIESANMIGLMISFLPGFMLSGMAFPLASVPPFLQFISYLFPGRYMTDIARGVFLRGAGWDVLTGLVLSLAVYAVVGLTLATVLNRKQA